MGSRHKDGADAAWKAFSNAGRGIANSFSEGFSEARKTPQKAPKRDGLAVPAPDGAGRRGPEVYGP